MRNIFTKAFVCTGVLASAMALSSVAVFAGETHTADFSGDARTVLGVSDSNKTTCATGKEIDIDDYFKLRVNGARDWASYVDGATTIYGFKFNSSSSNDYIKFTTVSNGATVTVKYSSNGTTARTLEFTPAVTADENNVTVNSTTPEELTFTTGAKGTYSFGCQNTFIYSVTVKESDDTSDAVTYDVKGTYSPATATLTATNGELNAAEGSYTLSLAEGTKGQIKATANNYYNYESDELSEANVTDGYNISMTAVEAASNDENTFSTDVFNLSAYGTLPESIANIAVLSGEHSANGFTINGTTNLQASTSSSRLQMGAGATVTYAPESAGTLTVVAQQTNGSNERKFTVSDGTTSKEYVPAKGGSQDTIDIEVEAGKTYTLTVDNTINFYSFTFAPKLTTGDFAANTASYGKVIVTNDATYVIAYITEALLDAESVDITINGVSKNTETVYNTVKADGISYTASTEGVAALYGLKITGVTSDTQVEKIKAFTVQAH